MAFIGQPVGTIDPTQQAIQDQVQAAQDWIKQVFWILIVVAIICIIFMSLKRA